MANTNSALKNIRKTARRTVQNNVWRVNVKKVLKELRINKDKSKLEEIKARAQSVIARAAKRNIFHKNKASRMISKIFSA